ncbi:hypothetical protein KVT40_009161 [Elsinoe batatas]|uniref:Uncharacterized protein n=1 Tax=Elsinoe batatas TaxID=2601811 RepID=A0A8K0KVR5_9PEZI|nr:hypothetical protein KVT40_009161 [Elsinoe batatas]
MDPNPSRRRTMRTHQTRTRPAPAPTAPTALYPDRHSPRPRTNTASTTSTSASTLPAPFPAPTRNTGPQSPPALSHASDPFAPTHLHEPESQTEEPVFLSPHPGPSPFSSSHPLNHSLHTLNPSLHHSGHPPLAAPSFALPAPGLTSSRTKKDRAGKKPTFLTPIPPLIYLDEEEEEGEEDEEAREREGREVDKRLLQGWKDVLLSSSSNSLSTSRSSQAIRQSGTGRGSTGRGTASRARRKGHGDEQGMDEEAMRASAEEIMARMREVVDERIRGERWRWEGGGEVEVL